MFCDFPKSNILKVKGFKYFLHRLTEMKDSSFS